MPVRPQPPPRARISRPRPADCRISGPTRPKSSAASPTRRRHGKLADDARAYAIDAQQRTMLALDILRERAEQDIAHEEAGTPPVLIYDYEVVLDGKTLPRPTNKMLLKIVPPDGHRGEGLEAPLHDRRSARRTRRGHRRLQVGQPGRGRAARRPPGLFRRVPPAPRTGPDARRRDAQRGGLRRQDPRASSRTRPSPSSSATARAVGRA